MDRTVEGDSGTMDEGFEGFSPRWKNFPDYILGITNDIWEGRAIGSLRQSYANDVVMRFPSGIVRGNDAVMNGTMATIHEFPDRQLYGEDVIWSKDETGYLSSHRLITVGTHLAGRRLRAGDRPLFHHPRYRGLRRAQRRLSLTSGWSATTAGSSGSSGWNREPSPAI
jgi:hypothetical protein